MLQYLAFNRPLPVSMLESPSNLFPLPGLASLFDPLKRYAVALWAVPDADEWNEVQNMLTQKGGLWTNRTDLCGLAMNS